MTVGAIISVVPVLVLFWDVFSAEAPLFFARAVLWISLRRYSWGRCPAVYEHGKIHSIACVKNKGACAHENTIPK